MTAARRLAVGVGCRSGVSADAVARLVREALDRVEGEPFGLFTAAAKQGEAAIADAAALLGLPLVHLPEAVLKGAADRAVTRSARVEALLGVPSVAETAALAGAGPAGRLALPRISAEGVTCAVASEDTGP